MKKNFFLTIFMVIVAILATSCNSYEVKRKAIDGTKLEYFSAQDPKTGGDLWGVREIVNPAKPIITPIYKNISKLGDFFILQTADAKKLADLSGAIVVSENFKEALRYTEPLDYIALDQTSLYLIKEKKCLGPWDAFLVTKQGIFIKKNNGISLISFDEKEILPAAQKEVIVITETKKVKGKEVIKDYLLAQNDKNVWTLYDRDGKKLKAVANWELKKYTKGSKETSFDGVFTSAI